MLRTSTADAVEGAVEGPVLLPTPPPDRPGVEAWVADHLGHLRAGDGSVRGSRRFRGGQAAAEAALGAFDITGYASRRNEVLPRERRGASGLSPWIRHGLLSLRRVWDHVEGGPPRDVRKFRDELLWQEYARHWYARLGPATRSSVRYELQTAEAPADAATTDDAVYDRTMACLDVVLEELVDDGWAVNQVRMWLASHWSVREGWDWQDGEDWLFARLLDGSRAANRLGWQWTTGAGSSKAYGFSRWQVEKRAPGLCHDCAFAAACPIEDWPGEVETSAVEQDPLLRRDHDPAGTGGPLVVDRRHEPDVVWLTAESLGDADPALVANPDLPVLFVFDEPLLASLRLDGKRLVFFAECLADLAGRREVEVHLGRPAEVLAPRAPAVTFAPVPGFRRLAATISLAEVHPWPWLARPHDGSVASFSAWRKRARP